MSPIVYDKDGHIIHPNNPCPVCKSMRTMWRPQRPMRNGYWVCFNCDATWDTWGGKLRITSMKKGEGEE